MKKWSIKSYDRNYSCLVQRIIKRKGEELTEGDINSLCKEKLGAFEVPKKVLFVDELPVTSTGKMRKVELREKYGDLFKGK